MVRCRIRAHLIVLTAESLLKCMTIVVMPTRYGYIRSAIRAIADADPQTILRCWRAVSFPLPQAISRRCLRE